MKSSDLQGFSEWKAWPFAAVAAAPAKPGVYVFRFSSGCYKRIHGGDSDIAYIGTTCRGRGGINGRLKSHRSKTRCEEHYALNRLHKDVGNLEVAWKECENHSVAIFEESVLLMDYCDQHIEFPPANHQQSFRKLVEVLRQFPKFSAPEQTKVIELLQRLSRTPNEALVAVEQEHED